MSRKRLTREDSREQTTQRLLEAAKKLIAKKGLEAASVENIAAAAGYSRGAFYSNFGSKEDLFIDLLRRDHQKSSSKLNALRGPIRCSGCWRNWSTGRRAISVASNRRRAGSRCAGSR